jgi:hypothetical protein
MEAQVSGDTAPHSSPPGPGPDGAAAAAEPERSPARPASRGTGPRGVTHKDRAKLSSSRASIAAAPHAPVLASGSPPPPTASTARLPSRARRPAVRRRPRRPGRGPLTAPPGQRLRASTGLSPRRRPRAHRASPRD